ncbi:MAG: hypothetical protein HXY21_13285 [Parvularculaceae bacterium]|nr:hypothetical protein [Parvularculaceae bacterium]
MRASLADLLKFAAMNLKAPLSPGRSALKADAIDRLQNEKSAAPGAHMALGIGNWTPPKTSRIFGRFVIPFGDETARIF